MKNIIIVVLLLIVIVAAYSSLSNMRMSMAMLQGETATLAIGDLTVPINATGEIKPVRRVIIKSEASGEVIEIAKQPGERVRAGDRIIRLQRDDEERRVNRAELAVTVAKAALEQAKTQRDQAKTADLAAARANVKQFEANIKLAKLRAERVLEDPDPYHEEERVQRMSTYESQLAQLDSAKAALQKVEYSIPYAEQAVIRSEAAFETAQDDLADAQKQLSKTDVASPIGGIVGDIKTQIGEVIQGGKSTFTGGTPLAYVLDVHKLMLQAEVDEAEIGRVLDLAPAWALPGHEATQRMPESVDEVRAAIDRPAVITVETFPEETFEGVIERIYPEPVTVQNVTTYLVDVVIISDNKDKLLPGMRAEVSFTSEHVEGVVLCPSAAIDRGPDGELGVFVPKKNPMPEEWPVEFVACRIGLSDGAFTEITSGLDEGTVVYTKVPPRRE